MISIKKLSNKFIQLQNYVYKTHDIYLTRYYDENLIKDDDLIYFIEGGPFTVDINKSIFDKDIIITYNHALICDYHYGYVYNKYMIKSITTGGSFNLKSNYNISDMIIVRKKNNSNSLLFKNNEIINLIKNELLFIKYSYNMIDYICKSLNTQYKNQILTFLNMKYTNNNVLMTEHFNNINEKQFHNIMKFIFNLLNN